MYIRTIHAQKDNVRGVFFFELNNFNAPPPLPPQIDCVFVPTLFTTFFFAEILNNKTCGYGGYRFFFFFFFFGGGG